MRIDQPSFAELNRARERLLITISKQQLLASERTRLMIYFGFYQEGHNVRYYVN